MKTTTVFGVIIRLVAEKTYVSSRDSDKEKEMQDVKDLINRILKRIGRRPWIPERSPLAFYQHNGMDSDELVTPSYLAEGAMFSLRYFFPGLLSREDFKGLGLIIISDKIEQVLAFKRQFVPIMGGRKHSYRDSEFQVEDICQKIPGVTWDELVNTYAYAEQLLLDIREKKEIKEIVKKRYGSLLYRLQKIKSINDKESIPGDNVAVRMIREHLQSQGTLLTPWAIMTILEVVPELFPEKKEGDYLNLSQGQFCESLAKRLKMTKKDLNKELIYKIVDYGLALDRDHAKVVV